MKRCPVKITMAKDPACSSLLLRCRQAQDPGLTTVLEALDRLYAAGFPFIPNFKSAYYLRKIRPGSGIEYKEGLRPGLAQR